MAIWVRLRALRDLSGTAELVTPDDLEGLLEAPVRTDLVQTLGSAEAVQASTALFLTLVPSSSSGHRWNKSGKVSRAAASSRTPV